MKSLPHIVADIHLYIEARLYDANWPMIVPDIIGIPAIHGSREKITGTITM